MAVDGVDCEGLGERLRGWGRWGIGDVVRFWAGFLARVGRGVWWLWGRSALIRDISRL